MKTHLFTILICVLTLKGLAVADVLQVPSDYPTIQGAIDAASSGDTISIAAGTYNEYELNPGGKAITIQGTLNNNGSLATIINPFLAGRVFALGLGEGPDTLIKDLVITGGFDGYGGGIHCDDSSPTITGCTIEGNSAYEGGGIYCENSSPTITACILESNTSIGKFGYGGGMFCNNSTPTITDCVFRNNISGNGGGLYNQNSSPSLDGCTFEGNIADDEMGYGWGGGLTNWDNSDPVLDGCRFISNQADSDGGGMINDGDADPSIINCEFLSNTAVRGGGHYSMADSGGTFVGCSFIGNTAEHGGGFHASSSSSIELTGCTFTNNNASETGGGFHNDNGDSAIEDCSFIGNSARAGAGFSSSSGNPNLEDCLFDQNTATDYGAGIYLYDFDFSTVENCILTNNVANRGTAIYCNSSNAQIRECVIQGNTGTSSAAGIYCINGGSPVIRDCQVIDNQALRATGIRCDSSNPSISGCTVANNIANGSPGVGAGILLVTSSPEIVECRIIDNQADLGAGFYAGSQCAPSVRSCVISNNEATQNGGGVFAQSTSDFRLSNSLICSNSPTQITGPWNDQGGNQVLVECSSCIGDLNGDDLVNVNDVLFLVSVWDEINPAADLDGDGRVDTDDLLILLGQYGSNCL